jgi:hypothetical protein
VRPSIREVDGERVGGRDDHTDVNDAGGDSLSEMVNVYDKEVATTGELDLNTKADTSAVPFNALRPIHSSNLFLGPASLLLEARVEKLPNLGATVRISSLFNQELEAGKDSFKFLP